MNVVVYISIGAILLTVGILWFLVAVYKKERKVQREVGPLTHNEDEGDGLVPGMMSPLVLLFGEEDEEEEE